MGLKFNRGGERPLLLFLLVLGLFGCSEYSLITHKKDVILYPPEKEVEIGLEVARQFMKMYPPVEDQSLQEKIKKIGERLVKVCDRKDIPYRFIVVDFPGKNAVSLPGGYVFISKELVDFCQNEDEIGSVLAHEIGHIVAKHGIKRMQASYLGLIGIAGGTSLGDGELTKGILASLRALFSAYSREDEFTADELGAKYMRLAGYDVKAMIDLFSRLDEEIRYRSDRGRIDYFRTHPYLTERIHNIRAKFLNSSESQFLKSVMESE